MGIDLHGFSCFEFSMCKFKYCVEVCSLEFTRPIYGEGLWALTCMALVVLSFLGASLSTCA